MLKIRRSTNGRVVLKLSGRIEGEDARELRHLLALETPGRYLVLDLRDVTLVNQDAGKFLAPCEADGIELEHCPLQVDRPRKASDQAGECDERLSIA